MGRHDGGRTPVSGENGRWGEVGEDIPMLMEKSPLSLMILTAGMSLTSTSSTHASKPFLGTGAESRADSSMPKGEPNARSPITHECDALLN